jgi:hypothetical protein
LFRIKLRAGIARGRLCASVLVISWRKMSLVEALHGRVAMAEVGTPWPAMGELAGEGREGEGKGRGVGATGGGGMGGGLLGALGLLGLWLLYSVSMLLYVRRKEEGEEKREKRK